MRNDSSILILSCDKFSDLWNTFFEQFWKNWPDCPYKVYLGSNKKKFNKDNRVINLLTGEDKNWSTSLKRILNQIPENNIFLWLEDAFIISKVNSGIFKLSFALLKQAKTKHIHFRPVPNPDNIKDNYFGEYRKGIPYRVNAIGFWKKKYLEDLLIDGENAWKFEIMGSYRASYDEGFYCLLKPALEFIHLIEKGYWLKKAYYYCQKNKINIDFNKRTILRFNLTNLFKDQYFNVIINISWAARVRLMNLLRKLLVSY